MKRRHAPLLAVLAAILLSGCGSLGNGRVDLDPRQQATLVQVSAGPGGYAAQFYHGPAPVLVEAEATTGDGRAEISSNTDNATSIWAAAVSALAGFVAGGV